MKSNSQTSRWQRCWHSPFTLRSHRPSLRFRFARLGPNPPSGPDASVKITEEYAKHVARDAYLWAWLMVNVYNRRLVFAERTDPVKIEPLIQAPVNQIAMLTDYVDPEERNVACPNQDVVYGIDLLELDLSPVVVQVPGLRRSNLGLSSCGYSH